MLKLLTALVVTITAFPCNPTRAQGPDGPCNEPEIQDTAEAITNPDRYAWRLFVELSQPGNLTTRCRDSSKAFGSDGPVVWETWRNVRPTAADTVFRPGAQNPGPWRSAPAPDVRTVADLSSRPIKQAVGLTTRDLRAGEAARVFADAAVGEGNEVRMNRTAYLFVRDNQLYDRTKQVAKAAAGELNLAFPPSAKEVKAQWRRIRDQDRPRYHWTIFELENGTREIWGLTGLHISTKDTPNWFWATFEHVDNKILGLPPGGGEKPNLGWQTATVDRHACPQPPYDCDQVPGNMGMQGTKWQHYRLRGTQVDFVNSIGDPTILSNSHIERTFQQSSCITCHARATIDRDGRGLGLELDVGSPQAAEFKDPLTGKLRFMQLDFVFSLERASQP